MSDTTKTLIRFNPISGFDHPTAGRIMVCVEDNGPITSKNILDQRFVALKETESEHRILPDDDEAGIEAIEFLRTVCYMKFGTFVTTNSQPDVKDCNGKIAWNVDVPEYGPIILEFVGTVEVDEDYFQIFVAHPDPGVHLVVIVEIISAEPLDFREIDLTNIELRDKIVQQYLSEIGANGSEEDDPEEPDENPPDYS